MLRIDVISQPIKQTKHYFVSLWSRCAPNNNFKNNIPINTRASWYIIFKILAVLAYHEKKRELQKNSLQNFI